MNNVQTNRTNMIETVLSYLAINAAIIVQSTGFANPITKVKELMEAAWAKDNERQSATKGKSKKKKNTLNDLTQQVLAISAALSLWALNNKNVELHVFAKLTKSEFEKHRDAEKVNAAKAFYNAAKDKDLTFADISEEDVENLNKLADEFKKDIAGLSTGATKRIAAGQTIDDMINEAIEIIKEEFDKYMQIYCTKKPEFYNGYKAARAIWDKGRKQNGENQSSPVQAA